jgi:hypothetical protein
VARTTNPKTVLDAPFSVCKGGAFDFALGAGPFDLEASWFGASFLLMIRRHFFDVEI